MGCLRLNVALFCQPIFALLEVSLVLSLEPKQNFVGIDPGFKFTREEPAIFFTAIGLKVVTT